MLTANCGNSEVLELLPLSGQWNYINTGKPGANFRRIVYVALHVSHMTLYGSLTSKPLKAHTGEAILQVFPQTGV